MHQLFDMACNFTSEQFNKDLDETIERAINANVSKFLVVSASLNDTKDIQDIYKKYKSHCAFTLGTHPHHASEIDEVEIQKMRVLISELNPNAIGETGLDFFRNISTYEEQLFAFDEQIKLAIEFNKPLYLHQRDAHEDFIKIIQKYKDDISKAVVHCFTGTKDALNDYLELGFHIGLTGWICDERRNVELRQIIKDIPHDKLMIETDSPFLIPRNLKNKPKTNRNEPQYLPHIAGEIAGLMSLETDDLIDITYKNSINFLNK
ncbi:TatD family hydrolase [Gammaproteobacteria bacterium]|nr:TatD family hydrolase [Gammaproteobacteria bacterium]